MKKIVFSLLISLLFVVWGATIYFATKNDHIRTEPSVETTEMESEAITETEKETTEYIETTIAETSAETQETSASDVSQTTQAVEEVSMDKLREHRVNETGQIYILMFHGFIRDELAGTFSDRHYTMTFSQFRQTLQFLYDNDYRPIRMDEFLKGHIDVPLGKIPIVMTFDDGRAGQFNLIEKNGELAVNPDSAVGIWMEFNEKYPDFKLKGTFYVNLGVATFDGSGTMGERLQYMIDLGFEIGNHTYSHEPLRLMTNKDDVIYQMGKNQEVMESLIPGYKFTSLALPFGEDVRVEELKEYVVKGSYMGTEYYNLGVLDCKWRPSYSPFDSTFDARSIYRVRADGLESVDCDMSDWMLNKLTTKKGQYISDGDPATVTVPLSLESKLDIGATEDKKIIIYNLD
jgi:hypothetical protein